MCGHVNVTASCTQSIHAMRILQTHDMVASTIHVIFDVIIIAKLTYAASSWWGFMTAEDRQRLKAVIRHGIHSGQTYAKMDRQKPVHYHPCKWPSLSNNIIYRFDIFNYKTSLNKDKPIFSVKNITVCLLHKSSLQFHPLELSPSGSFHTLLFFSSLVSIKIKKSIIFTQFLKSPCG